MIRKFFSWASPSLLVTLSVGAIDRSIERRQAKAERNKPVRKPAPLPQARTVHTADSLSR